MRCFDFIITRKSADYPGQRAKVSDGFRRRNEIVEFQADDLTCSPFFSK